MNTNVIMKINDEPIEMVKTHIFLGVVLDQKLTWKSHIAHINTTIKENKTQLQMAWYRWTR